MRCRGCLSRFSDCSDNHIVSILTIIMEEMNKDVAGSILLLTLNTSMSLDAFALAPQGHKSIRVVVRTNDNLITPDGGDFA